MSDIIRVCVNIRFLLSVSLGIYRCNVNRRSDDSYVNQLCKSKQEVSFNHIKYKFRFSRNTDII